MFNWLESRTVNGWCGMMLIVVVSLLWTSTGLFGWNGYMIAMSVINTLIIAPLICPGLEGYLNTIFSAIAATITLTVMIILWCHAGFVVSVLLLCISVVLAVTVAVLQAFTSY